jgi:ABC-2 type transport system permease protein
MRETLVVMRRELRSYFVSPIGYVLGALILGTSLFLGIGAIAQGALSSASGFFSWFPIVFLLFLPFLTMRLWAEERKLGTLELLMTFPVRIGQLIAGKFLAAMFFLAVLLLLTLGYPLVLDHYGDLDWGPVVGAYLGALLMAGSYIAVGMFFSSLTRDQIVAGILSLFVLVALFLLGWPGFLQLVERTGAPDWLVGLLGGLSPFKYFMSIARGVFDTRDLCYYAVFCGFFLHLNALVLRGRRLRG